PARQRMRRLREHTSARADDGMTLVELLMAVMLLGIIFAALTGAMALAFYTLDTSRQTVTDSSGAQLLSSYLPNDVQSVGNPAAISGATNTTDHVDPTDFSCDPGDSGLLLELRWA